MGWSRCKRCKIPPDMGLAWDPNAVFKKKYETFAELLKDLFKGMPKLKWYITIIVVYCGAWWLIIVVTLIISSQYLFWSILPVQWQVSTQHTSMYVMIIVVYLLFLIFYNFYYSTYYYALLSLLSYAIPVSYWSNSGNVIFIETAAQPCQWSWRP